MAINTFCKLPLKICCIKVTFLQENEIFIHVYKSIHVFDFLDKYYKVSDLNISEGDKIVKKDIEEEQLLNWKTYYYLSICLEKQRK